MLSKFFLPCVALTFCTFASAALAAVPSGNSTFNIRDYGAMGDGRQLDRAAINRAIETCAAAGGGTVLVPPGRYLTGTITLKSHVSLEIAGGATILGSQNPDDYPATKSVWGDTMEMMAPLIYAEDAENITVTGRGTIDGQGTIWWKRLELANPKP